MGTNNEQLSSISVELLEEVLGIKVTTESIFDKHIKSIKIEDNQIKFWIMKTKKTIDIYNFALNNCIEWSFKRGYKLKPFKHDINTYFCRIYKDGKELTFTKEKEIYLAIIKACNFIYEKDK